jgi:hypothetical protein
MAARLVLQKILSWQHMTCVSQVLLLLLIGKYTRAKEFRENNNNNKKSSGACWPVGGDIFRNLNMSTLGDNVKSISKSIFWTTMKPRGSAE